MWATVTEIIISGNFTTWDNDTTQWDNDTTQWDNDWLKSTGPADSWSEVV